MPAQGAVCGGGLFAILIASVAWQFVEQAIRSPVIAPSLRQQAAASSSTLEEDVGVESARGAEVGCEFQFPYETGHLFLTDRGCAAGAAFLGGACLGPGWAIILATRRWFRHAFALGVRDVCRGLRRPRHVRFARYAIPDED